MRINLNSRARVDSEEARPQSGSRAVTAPAGREAKDTAEVSLDGARVQLLAAQLNRLPEIRQERVAALGLAIERGNYHVTAEQTAEAMIAEARFAA